MSFVNWVIDSLASEDIIDLYFIMSDLVDINLSEGEIYESACLDSLSSVTVQEHQVENKIPLGKQVW
jgi:hypothetical protein